jgi:TonB family protein
MLVGTMRKLIFLGLIAGVGVGVGVSQQAGVVVDGVATTGKVYEVGPDVVAPELLLRELKIPEVDACTRESDDEIGLSLIVDANGKPRDVKLINPVGTDVERLAMRIVEGDVFEPGTLNGAAVQVRMKVRVSIEGCYATKKDAAGNSIEVFRLTAQPKQTFGEKKRQEYIPPEPETSEPEETARPDVPKPVEAEISGLEHVGKNGVSRPVPLNSVSAKYSLEARKAKVEGVCIVSLVVDAQGNPQNPRIVRSLGYGLDDRALEAVKKYRFKPAMKGKLPVPVMVTVEINFRLY